MLPRWTWPACAALLLWIFGWGLATNPARWEEPRRCLVAMEMIERGDYVVPHLQGMPYRAKPPLQAWTIALFAGFELERVSAFTARLVSVAAGLGILLLLWRLGIDGRRASPHPLPPLIFAGSATVIQFGRSGEIDILFCFFVTAAWAAFEHGRRRGLAWLQWGPSQGLVALGFLTKGLAPLFFYPPVLLRTLTSSRGKIRPAWGWFVAGLLFAVLIAAAWLMPYSRLAPAEKLGGQFGYELWRLTMAGGGSTVLTHLVTYPFLILGVAFPWSLVPLLWGRAGWLELGRLWREDPYHGLAVATVGWGVLVYLFIPGVDGRYLIPILPFASVLLARVAAPPGTGGSTLHARLGRLAGSRVFWAVAAALLVLYAVLAGRDLAPDIRVSVWIAVLLGLALLGVFAASALRGGRASGLLPLVALSLMYGVAFTGIWESRQVRRNRPYVEAAATFAAAIRPGLPVQCDCPRGYGRKIALPLGPRIGHVAKLGKPATDAYYVIVPDGAEPPADARLVEDGWRFDLWSVGPVSAP